MIFLTGKAAKREFCRLTPLELYCLHDVIQNIVPERQSHLQSMHNKLAQIFKARDETALFWLSRFFEERETFFQGNAEIRNGSYGNYRELWFFDSYISTFCTIFPPPKFCLLSNIPLLYSYTFLYCIQQSFTCLYLFTFIW